VRSFLILSAVLIGVALASCGDGKDAPPGPGEVRAPAATTAPPLLTCPVEGTRFRKGEGVAVRGSGGKVEVCSEGCRYRFELEPEAYRGAGDGR
jgi:hypothetical protein